MTCRILVLLPLCLAIVLTAETARSGDKKEQEKLEGTWSLVKITGGKSPKEDKDKDAKITFKGNKITFIIPGDKTKEATYSVDPTKKPKQLTVHLDRNGKKVTILGIYELNGDTLKICHFDGDTKSMEGRPKELVANEETILAMFKRDKRK
jgi:uncharacterized protein (TIGR03067 family)